MSAVYFEQVSHGRDNNFNLIRMIAASAVLVSHAYPLTLGPEAIQPLKRSLDMTLGHVAVLVFFAISGFLITKSFDRNQDWRRFLRARFWRLVPALAFVLVVTIVFSGLFLTTAPPGSYLQGAATYFLRNITLVNLQYPLPGVFEGLPYGPAINGSLWTLFYEVVCYMSVLALGLSGVLGNRLVSSLVLAGFLILLVFEPYLPLDPKVGNLIALGAPFAIGGWIYIWRDSVPFSLWIGALLVVATLTSHTTPFFEAMFSVALAYTTLALGFARVPFLLPYNRLGDFSYGAYVFAFPIQQLMASYGATTPISNMALAFPLTLIMAVISWHLIEAPALRRVHSAPQVEAGAA